MKQIVLLSLVLGVAVPLLADEEGKRLEESRRALEEAMRNIEREEREFTERRHDLQRRELKLLEEHLEHAKKRGARREVV